MEAMPRSSPRARRPPVRFDRNTPQGAISLAKGTPMSLDPRLLEILICPACHGDLNELEAEGGLECVKCGRIYPIRDGIPVMLVDQASPPTREPDES